jgi:hypothetical protein
LRGQFSGTCSVAAFARGYADGLQFASGPLGKGLHARRLGYVVGEAQLPSR